MTNRAADGKKEKRIKKRGRTFFGECAELTFTEACFSLTSHCLLIWKRSCEKQRLDKDLFQNTLTGERAGVCPGCCQTLIRDIAAGSVRGFFTESFQAFTEHIRYISGLTSEPFPNNFSKNNDAKRV